MTADFTLMQEITEAQVENEWSFVLSVIGAGGASAMQECAWLEPDIFIDKVLGKFWERVRLHGDSLRATEEAQVDPLEWAKRLSSDINLTRSDEYARRIAEYHYYHTIMENSLEIVKGVRDRDLPKVQLISEKLHALTPCNGTSAYTGAQVSTEFVDDLKKVHVGSILTMISEFDHKMGGLFPTELTVLAGRPGTGKTALALQFARNVAVSGKKVLFLSLEMSRVQLWARMACGDAGIEWKEVRAGRVDKAGLEAVARASDALQKLLGCNMLIQDEIWTLSEIQQSVALHKPDLVIIDHLGEITRQPESLNDIEWYPRAVKYIRRYITRRRMIPTILIHQLNRNVEAREDKRPVLSDLRASGEIEQLADIVIMGYREDYYNEKMSHLSRVPFELWVRKNRQGQMNDRIDLVYDLKKQWFDSFSPMSPLP